MSGLIQWGENALKKSLFRLFQNGGGGGIRTNIFAFCSFKFYPVTSSIIQSWKFVFSVTFNNFQGLFVKLVPF